MRVCFRCAIFTAMLLSTAGAYAQDVIALRTLTLEAAKTIAAAALTKCASQGYNTAVAVIDRSGNLLAFLRDEQAPQVTIDMARDKAYTALQFRSATLEFQQGVTTDPARAPLRDIPGILALGGGVPIFFENEVIGAVASSGAGQGMDDACARAGIASVEGLSGQP